MKKKVNVFGKEMSVFAIVMIAMVGLASAALLPYFGIITGTVTVSQGLLVDGQGMDDSASLIDTYTGFTSLETKTTVSGEHNLTNNADVNANVNLNSNCSSDRATSSCDEADIKIMGTLELTKKDVNFSENSPPWVIPNNAGKVQIKYMIVGDKFTADVVENGIPGYVLVYYGDNDVRFANPGEAVLIVNVTGNLPAVDDANANVNDYSAEYPTTPHGAKIWYVPSNAIPGGVIDWARASEFYFESSLIQYNAEGNITVYPTEVLDFTIESDFPLMTYPGTYTITTTVDSQ